MADSISKAVKEVADGVKKMTTSDKAPKAPKAPKQSVKKDKKAPKGGAPSDGPDELSEPPAFFEYRIKMFDRLKAEHDAEIAKKPREKITITFPDGKVTEGTSWETSPAELARNLSKSLFERTVISEVDGELWDLERPLEKSCSLKFIDFDDPKGKRVFWHSSAHILGEAAERRFACNLCIGPPVDDGFYYEMALPDGTAVVQTDLEPIERVAAKIVKEKQPFVRLSLTKANLLKMFEANKYKQHIIRDKIPDGTSTTVYRCGPLIDLCLGPHVPHTGRIKSFKVMKTSASYFLGDPANDSLQRIYGVSFPDKKLLEQHLHHLEEAAKRDHRKIGREQELFFFHDLSPGSAFFLPHGAIIYNNLQEFLRKEYWKRGYQEVHSPNLFNSALWETSGHWQMYKDDMFTFPLDKEQWAIKPMNCPGHCLIFKFRERSYRELPLRMAEFGICHRNEASGALTGLTRVRRFLQDDTHIFCTPEQIGQEMAGLFDFLDTVYGQLGLGFKLRLSTRPEKYLGAIEDWDHAEAMLTKSLDEFAEKANASWILNPQDGAFYGPKIDVKVTDALNREFQCATIQLDFQLPQRFELDYQTAEKTEARTESKNEDSSAETKKPEAPAAATKEDSAKKGPKPLAPGTARPVMIHRAVLGSFERFVAILTEHFAGKWPFWLSPRQILIVPVMVGAHDYVLEVQKVFRAQGMHADVDIGGNTLQKKLRTGALAQYNFLFVVGAQEIETRTVNVWNRDDPATHAKGACVPLDTAVERLIQLRESRAIVTAI